MIATILVGWLIALPEYALQVPANRFGYGQFSAFQLKIIQEVLSLTAFVVFAKLYPGEGIRWKHMISFKFLVLAVIFAFRSPS